MNSIYDGMEMFGQDGYIWSIDLGGRNCGSMDSSCKPLQPTNELDLYRTRDGGATWTKLPSSGVRADGAYFSDASHGWIFSGSPLTGLNGYVLYATADGGVSWSQVGGTLPPAPNGWIYGLGLYHVTFHGDRGWYIGNGFLYTSTDGGRSWAQLGVPTPPGLRGWTVTMYQPSFNGPDGVLPVAYRDPTGADNATANLIYLFTSHDGGATWVDPRPAPAGFAPVGDDLTISILDMKHIWLTSQSASGGDNVQARPSVARTSDGGISWTVTQMPWRILHMIFRDATHGYALDVTGVMDVNGILSTHDGGATWQRVNVPVFS